MSEGGTELAPMSTSSDVSVALHYSSQAEKRLIFKIVTANFLDRGADLRYLSAFPAEAEFLYSPLTYLRPTGRHQSVLLGEGDERVECTVVEVVPYYAS